MFDVDYLSIALYCTNGISSNAFSKLNFYYTPPLSLKLNKLSCIIEVKATTGNKSKKTPNSRCNVVIFEIVFVKAI